MANVINIVFKINILSKYTHSSKILQRHINTYFSLFRYWHIIPLTEGRVIQKKKKENSLFVCGKVKGQKNISYGFLLSRLVSRKLGLDRDESLKKHISFRIQRSKKHSFLSDANVKKTFSTSFYFQIQSRKNRVLVEVKDSKNIISFRI